MTDQEREDLEYFASLLFSDGELAKIMEMDPDEFRLIMKMESGEIYKTVTKARFQSECRIRQGIINMAERNSTPAQTMAIELMKRMRKDSI